MEITINVHPTLIREWQTSLKSLYRAQNELDEFDKRDGKYDFWKLDKERHQARIKYLTKERNEAMVRNFSLGERIVLLVEKAASEPLLKAEVELKQMMDVVFPSRL